MGQSADTAVVAGACCRRGDVLMVMARLRETMGDARECYRIRTEDPRSLCCIEGRR
jgi:hypothetical protein